MNSVSKLSLTKVLIRSQQSVSAQIAWIALFAAATALGARIEIAHQPVPYTMQTLVVLLAGAFLGPRNGAISQLLYLSAGVLGAPVFAAGGFGIAKLFGPTGGYLLAFPVAAALVGYLVRKRKSLLWSFTSMAMGLFVIFASGTAQLYAVYFQDWAEAFGAGFLMFSWWDTIKLSAAAMTYHEVAKRWPIVPNESE